VLTASRPDRLPATVASRCQRLPIRTPATADALAWLSGIDATVEWAGTLALAAGAPVRALELARAGVLELEREMAELPAKLSRPDVDLVGLAERCQERLPAERLRWIENWVTDRIRRGLKGPAADHSPGSPGLPSLVRTRHIQGLYAILDELRAAQAALRGSANVTMLWERVLGLLARELSGLRAARPR
jgi:DNA polymerase-3 subunit delta'